MELNIIECKKEMKNSLNSLSPYVGKMRPDLAKFLIHKYAKNEGVIYDPFAGSGTVLLEGWASGHDVVGVDLNYYAYVVSMGKIYPYKSLKEAEHALTKYKKLAEKRAATQTLYDVPEWVRMFYNDETLKEICSWVFYLKKNKEWFLLACLMGILHHQRPGFLSFPASHGAPYLRCKKYPRDTYPEMYEYKNVYERLYKKVVRSYRNTPQFDHSLSRKMYHKDATRVGFRGERFSTIITSPPYMKSLTYARDNRLRLWFLGEEDWSSLDKTISPDKNDFLKTMEKCFKKWAKLQVKGDKCIIVIGDIRIKHDNKSISLAEALIDLAKKNYICAEQFQDPIPEKKKTVKGNSRIKREIIIVFERK